MDAANANQSHSSAEHVDDFKARLSVRQVEVLYQQLPVSIATNVGASIFYCLIVWHVADRLLLGAWIGVVLLLSVVRGALGARFARAPQADQALSKWRHSALVMLVLSGLLWSLGLIAVTPADADDEYHIFTMLWIVGLSAGSMGAYSVLPTAYLAFAGTLIMPYVIYLTLTGYQSDFMGSLALLMFFGFLWFCARRLHTAILQSLKLEFQNLSLIDDLNNEKAEIQRLNEGLEGLVDERTSELVGTNQRLQAEIHEREEAESQLRSSEARYRTLYHQTPSMFFTLDRHGTILRVNEYGARKLGYEPQELKGKPFPIETQRSGDPDLTQELGSALEHRGHARKWECGVRKRDGEKLWVSASAQAAGQNLTRQTVLLVCEDITKARELADTLAYHATHDALTGLVNRREFETRLVDAVESARRGPNPHALLYMDLDLFKVVNDTCGHSAGDELLRELASVLSKEVGRDDTLARLGGDEFGVILMDCSLDDAVRAADRLRKATEELRFRWNDRTLRVGMSIGVVPIDAYVMDATALMQCADTACYVSKEHGRNRVHVYDSADEELTARNSQTRWVNRINEALDDDRLQLHFQTIAALSDKPDCPSRYEILVRMVDLEGATISAGEFLPAAERYGLTPRIDRWVIAKTLQWLGDRPDEIARLDFCSINLSGLSLADEKFQSFVVDALSKSKVPGSKLVFEITETAAISQLGAATRLLDALNRHGCRFALDDFGTGLSSFAYLKNLPVDFLKIDGVFVRDIVNDPVDLAMVRSINEMGHVMGIGTIAECVEDEATLNKLREIGVDHAQGFFIDLPRSMNERISPCETDPTRRPTRES